MASKATESKLTGTTVGRFVIRERLAAGGMGEVYKAEDTLLKRTVALKRILPGRQDVEKSRHRILREARCASRLNHPNIAAIYDVMDSPAGILLVMELIEGKTLRERMQAPLSTSEFLDLAKQCAAALDAAHSGGVVHRDIKPENIMLTASGQLKILDFGIARGHFSEENSSTVENLSTENLAGTVDYMAPEVIDRGRANARSDLFSLGVVFYEMLASLRPFRGKTFFELCEQILRVDPTPIRQARPEIPESLCAVVTRLLAKNPSERYASAADLLRDLAIEPQGPEWAPPTGAKSPSWFRDGRRILIWSLIPLLALAAVFVLPDIRDLFPDARTALTLPLSKQVAVLPFTTVSSNPADTAFSLGLADTLTAKLTQLTTDRTLQVVPAGEVQANRIRTVSEAHKKFGVNLVLEGNVARAGDMLRINFALVDARTMRQLRAATVTEAAANSFAVQDEVVESVAQLLDLSLTPSQATSLKQHETQVAGAYDFYLQGKGYLSDYNKPQNIESALTVFHRALSLDPNYGLAYAGIGQAYFEKYRSTNDPQWIEPSRQACVHALNIDRALASAHTCLGWVYIATGNYKSAAQEFENAVEIEPTSDDGYRGLANAYQQIGDMKKAEETYRRAIRFRPQYWAGYNWLGAFYYSQGRYREAAQMFEQVIALSPDNSWGYSNLAVLDLALGRYQEAIPLLKRSLSIEETPAAESNLGTAYFYLRQFQRASDAFAKAAASADKGYNGYMAWWNLGDGYYFTPSHKADAARAYRRALSISREALKLNPRDTDALGVSAICYAMLDQKSQALEQLREGLHLTPSDPEMNFKAALIYNHFGDSSAALHWIGKALNAHFSATTVRDTPFFDNLRSDPRFEALLKGR